MRRSHYLSSFVGALLLALGACSSDESATTGPATGGASSASSGTGGAATSTSAATGGASTTSTGGQATGGQASGGTGGAASCPSTHTCAEEPPVNWTGPVAVYVGAPSTVPACVGNYPSDSGDLFADLDSGTAACSCACDPATGIQCTSSVNICYVSSQTNCIVACLTPKVSLAPGQCTPIPATGTSLAQVGNPPPTSPGSCVATDTSVIPTATWMTAARVCGGATTIPTGCNGGEVCTPLAIAPFDKLCIERTGDVECPSAYYSDKHVVFTDFTDTRQCSACSCGSAASTCGGKVAFTSSSCQILDANVNAGSCASMGGATDATYAPAPSGTCPPSPSTLSGSATPNSPVTLCCH